MRLVVVDCETSGPMSPPGGPPIDLSAHEVTETALVVFDDGRIVAAESVLHATTKPIPSEITAYTGIDAALVARTGAHEPYAAYRDALAFRVAEETTDAPLVGHYLLFDAGMLCLRGVRNALCTKALAALDPTRPEGASTSLGATCERHGISLVGAHSALMDAIATGQLARKLLDALGIEPYLDGYARISEERVAFSVLRRSDGRIGRVVAAGRKPEDVKLAWLTAEDCLEDRARRLWSDGPICTGDVYELDVGIDNGDARTPYNRFDIPDDAEPTLLRYGFDEDERHYEVRYDRTRARFVCDAAGVEKEDLAGFLDALRARRESLTV